ncbi:hypothetical protein GJAV_G00170540 [Gymnothorax javanicus]|nr:hypothetical protein GJAV_G00170540 [Gymnothorax javanicus]
MSNSLLPPARSELYEVVASEVRPALSEEMCAVIMATIPSVPADTQNKIIERLIHSGVETNEDLSFVKEEDIANLLHPVQVRKLLAAFQSASQTDPPGSSVVSPNSTLSSSSAASTPRRKSSSPCPRTLGEFGSPRSLTPTVSVTWPETFQVPWEQMPAGIWSAIANGKRPTPADRHQMVRVLADEMCKFEANPTRSQCQTVTQKIVRQYPKSFSDAVTVPGVETIGYCSLLSQLKVRIEHLNRNNTLARRRMQKSTEDGPTTKKRLTDSYGCTRWQPEPPPGESEETLEEKRLRLEELFQQEGASGADRGEVAKLMDSSYCLQRRMINTSPAPTIEELQKKWPYFFFQKFIYAHFELLTDKDVLRMLELSMEECGKAILAFFKSKPTNEEVRAVLSMGEDGEIASCVTQLLLAHFKEKDGLILQADVSATAADVERTLALPQSPRLIILGETLSRGRWMLSMDGHVTCEGSQPTFISGLAAVIAAYYNFNYQYEEAACTLEFIQRRFLDINPERGTKGSRKKVTCSKTGKQVQKKQTTVNPHVSSLMRKLMDFEWNFLNE